MDIGNGIKSKYSKKLFKTHTVNDNRIAKNKEAKQENSYEAQEKTKQMQNKYNRDITNIQL